MEVKIMGKMTTVDILEDLVMKIRNAIQHTKQNTRRNVYTILRRFAIQSKKKNAQMWKVRNVKPFSH